MDLRIKELLKQKGISLVALSGRTGIEKGNLSNIVNNKKNPTVETLEKLALAIGVEVSEFFTPSSSSGARIRCPHCGGTVNIKAE